MAKADLTAARLRDVLTYDPDTGVFRWRVERRAWGGRVYPGDVAGTHHGNGYLDIGVDGRTHYAHRLAWLYMTGQWPTMHVDHRNRIRSDNRWDNLRHASVKQNQENRTVRKDSATGIKGVTYIATSGRWRAIIKHDFKSIHLGCFLSKDDAIAARVAAEQRFFTHGEPQA